MRSNVFKKIAAVLLIISTMVSSIVCFAQNNTVQNNDDALQIVSVENDYTQYLNSNVSFVNADENISVNIVDFFANGSNATVESNYADMGDAVLWKNGEGEIGWIFSVSESGFYNFKIEFLPLDTGANVELELLIDGKSPFDSAKKLVFTKDWKNSTDGLRIDKDGNEITPEQIETGEKIVRFATDSEGVNVEPYLFALEAGEHSIAFVGSQFPIAIFSIEFTAPEKNLSYAELSESYKFDYDNSIEPIVIQGEDAALKSDNSLIPKTDNSNASMTPASPNVSKINYIGGSAWQTPGQFLEWEFEISKAGYYSLGTRFKQNELINGESWRKTPFKEANELRFPYKTGWQYYTVGGEENPYYIWLDEGKHTLTLEVTMGEMSSYYARLKSAVDRLGDLYLNIVMVTGEVPDVNRDYELFKQIPNMNDILSQISKDLESLTKDMQSLNNNYGNQYTSAINNMNRIISRMLDAPYIAHIYVKDYYTNYTTLCSWLNEMKKMPLAIDEIRFAHYGSKFNWKKTNLIESLAFGAKRLLNSYIESYSIKDDTTNSIKLWVNWGRDQAMVLDSIIADSFTSETGIEVDVKIVNNSLINGLLANNFPDVMLNLSRTDPVNFGMRGALVDLTQFEDYKEILERFQTSADTPYWYNGALYALPDQQNFYCMFYRTDIFDKLGLSAPKTWNEFLNCATILQRYNMNVFVPYTKIETTTTVNSGIGSLNLYPTLMLQSGLNIYNEELNSTAIDSEAAIKVFDRWTDMYTDYGYLQEADFYNRFRNGSMPLGITTYNMYTTFYSAAPEIKDRWSVAKVCGTENGNDYVAGSGTGCGIVSASDKQKDAWEFLKWWTSAETQTRYSNNVESILGVLGRIW